MKFALDPSGTYIDPEIVNICDGNYITLACQGELWTYGYVLDNAIIKCTEQCSRLNSFFETRANALEAALMEVQRKLRWADCTFDVIGDTMQSVKRGNPSINQAMLLTSIEDVHRANVMAVLHEIFP